MKANELRIGNWIGHDYNDYSQVFHLDEDVDQRFRINYVDSKLYYPIPLTEGWLLKFGFEKTGSVWMLNMPKHESTLQTWQGNEYVSIYRSGIAAYHSECKYVHQLQNLYFALTQTELELKQI